MENIVIIHEEFNSRKVGISIVAAVLSLLFLLAELWLGILFSALTITFSTLIIGMEFDPNKKQYRYFKSFYGRKSGAWNSLEKYPAQIILKKDLKGEILSPKLVNSIEYTTTVYDVILTNSSHRARLSLKKFRTLDEAMEYAKEIQEKLEIPLEKYNPVISDKTLSRRRRRGR